MGGIEGMGMEDCVAAPLQGRLVEKEEMVKRMAWSCVRNGKAMDERDFGDSSDTGEGRGFWRPEGVLGISPRVSEIADHRRDGYLSALGLWSETGN
jgi:hypothetical protein